MVRKSCEGSLHKGQGQVGVVYTRSDTVSTVYTGSDTDTQGQIGVVHAR